MKTNQRLMSVVLLPLMSAVALAQTPTEAPAQEPVFELSPFAVESTSGYQATNAVSAAKVNVSLKELPLTINVITQDFIRDIGASNLMEAVRFTTGVLPGATSATGGSGGGAANNFTESFIIRGQDVRFTYRDGVRRWRGAEPAFMDRIEVIKGPTAILYGQALPGGTLNFVSRRPLYESYGMVSLGVDSFGAFRGEVDATGPLGNNGFAAYRVGLVHNEGETFVDYEELDYTGMSGTFEVKPWKGGSIRLNAELLDRRVDNARVNGTAAWRGSMNEGTVYTASGSIGQPIGIHPLADEATNPYGADALGSYVDTETRGWTLLLEQNLMEGLDLRVAGTYTSQMVESLSSGNNDVNTFDAPLVDSSFAAISGTPGDTVLIAGQSYVVGLGDNLAGNTIANATPGAYRNGVQKVAVYRASNDFGPLRFVGNSLGAPGLFNPNQVGPRALSYGESTNVDRTLQIDLTYAFDIGGVRSRVVAGYDMLDGKLYRPNTTGNPAWGGNNIYGVGYDLERGIPVDIFGNEWTKPGPTSNLFTTGESRSDSKDDSIYATYMGSLLDERLHLLLGVRDSTLKQRNNSTSPFDEFSKTVAQYGALYSVTDALAVYASLSESFLLNNARFPNKEPSPQNPGAYEPNGLFPPQEGEGLDIGVKFDLMDGRLSGNLTYFNIKRTEIPIVDPDVLDIDGNAVYFPGGEEEVDGVELELFWKLNEQLQLIGGITYVDSQYVKVSRGQEWRLGLPRDGTSEWQASAYAKYSFAEGGLDGLSVSGGAYYVSAEALGRPFEHGSYVVADASVSYAHDWNGLRMTYVLNARNLFDEIVYKGFTGADPGRGFYLSARAEF